MDWKFLFESSGVATIVTALVTAATCIIGGRRESFKFKLQYYPQFQRESLKMLETYRQASYRAQCRKLDAQCRKFSVTDPARLGEIYDQYIDLLVKYSDYLEALSVGFTGDFPAGRLIIRARQAECWDILQQYGIFVKMLWTQDYKIEYSQIVSLVYFIKLRRSPITAFKLYRYFRQYLPHCSRLTDFGRAFL